MYDVLESFIATILCLYGGTFVQLKTALKNKLTNNNKFVYQSEQNPPPANLSPVIIFGGETGNL